MPSGVKGSGARSNAGGFEHQIIIEIALLRRIHQTSGVRPIARARRRGHLAKFGGAAVCGGVRERNLVSREGWDVGGVWVGGPAMWVVLVATEARPKKFFSRRLEASWSSRNAYDLPRL